VRVAWHHAGGGVLPPTLADIVTRTQPVTLDAARIGDFVLYGKPASHIAIYLGHGYMVDASPSLRRVVVRRVFVSPTVRLVRLPAT
jgi:cell wall-associated NlpC family hydrolase